MDFTQEQIDKLNSLGISVQPGEKELVSKPKNPTSEIRHLKSNVFPLLSISGLTILSFGGLVLLKGKGQNNSVQPSIADTPSSNSLTPTQVPKSIQHYLLTSQQFFSQALQLQQQKNNDPQPTVELLNQSILAATQAIKDFPKDYRGYQQRGLIYQSLIDSKPELINQSISDISTAQKLNSSSAEISRTLASLYAKKGDVQNTIIYLNQTVTLEPTKAQNFYDLAKIQQQAGLLPQALETYNRLITLVTDSSQKTQIESEKSAIEKLLAQNPSLNNVSQNPIPSVNNNDLPTNLDSPTIQATDITNQSGLIVAAPEVGSKIEINNQTDSNSLTGNSILKANQKEIIINNDNLKSTSQVYLTITKGGKNQNLQITSKSNKSFTVGLDSSINEDIQFKWWIIN